LDKEDRFDKGLLACYHHLCRKHTFYQESGETGLEGCFRFQSYIAESTVSYFDFKVLEYANGGRKKVMLWSDISLALEKKVLVIRLNTKSITT
jgi:hypothetical protein